ncbi:MAG: cytochrome c5 family protein [Legionella sp. 40-6]|nr:cytochrome c5 family protein [Legionella sp.]OJY13825.1 MAG: cytochrome c5 family protein [Legionella sp. 40-6]
MFQRRVFLFLVFHAFTHCVIAASHHPQDFLQKIRNTKNESEQIYQHFCSTCHASSPTIPLGAPRLKNIEDWRPRLKQGINQLLLHTYEGMNAMPPRGGCFECTDEQLKSAVLFMLPKQETKH